MKIDDVVLDDVALDEEKMRDLVIAYLRSLGLDISAEADERRIIFLRSLPVCLSCGSLIVPCPCQWCEI